MREGLLGGGIIITCVDTIQFMSEVIGAGAIVVVEGSPFGSEFEGRKQERALQHREHSSKRVSLHGPYSRNCPVRCVDLTQITPSSRHRRFPGRRTQIHGWDEKRGGGNVRPVIIHSQTITYFRTPKACPSKVTMTVTMAIKMWVQIDSLSLCSPQKKQWKRDVTVYRAEDPRRVRRYQYGHNRIGESTLQTFPYKLFIRRVVVVRIGRWLETIVVGGQMKFECRSTGVSIDFTTFFFFFCGGNNKDFDLITICSTFLSRNTPVLSYLLFQIDMREERSKYKLVKK